MKTILSIIRPLLLAVLTLGSFTVSTLAQEVTIPDTNLDAVIRQALQKPNGPLTQSDMLSLTNLSATNRNIRSIEGLETARNLSVLHLNHNALTNVALPNTLTNLGALDLSSNPLRQCTIPGGLTNLGTLTVESCQLNNFTLPANLTGLTTLELMNNHLTTFTLPAGLPNLTLLDLSLNSLTQCSIPAGMTNLQTLFLQQNSFNDFTLPSGLTGLSVFHLWANHLTSFTLPVDTTNLTALLLNGNQLTNVTLPGTLGRLDFLDLDFNQFRNFTLPAGMTQLSAFEMIGNQLTNITLSADITNLTFLDLEANNLPNFTLPAGLTRLRSLRLGANQLTSFTLPAGMTNLTDFAIAVNQLTNLVLPSDLFNVVSLDLGENFYSNFIFPRGLTNLVSVDLGLCQLTNLTLAPDMTQLTTLFVLGNPFVTFVISEPMAATNLAPVVAELRNQGVSVFTYPLVARLVQPLMLAGSFKFGITGPPGVYSILGSTNFATWSAVGVTANPLGSVIFHDAATNVLPHKFYRALLQGPPTNMVFIPPNTFTMGSPTNEPDRNNFTEGPQATVTLTRGFWIGKYEVTQGEYLAVTGENPSNFPGDLRRPISSVTWFDATNYCWKLTQQELAAGRISPGSHYRLPTEAEWECAARAGTTTRFSYGDDDQNYSSLTNYAWFLDLAHIDLIVHPVGSKLPNPWGIYDMHGHLWEWCLDWYGDQVGGVQTDPTGPPGPLQFGQKVMRGGAYDYPSNDCRSASRFFRPANQPDSDLGFRVVLVMEP